MAANLDLPIGVGDTLRVAEPDYRYGTGDLRLRVVAIGAVTQESDGAWLHLRGVELLRNGAEGPERIVSVRFSALAGAKRSGMAAP